MLRLFSVFFGALLLSGCFDKQLEGIPENLDLHGQLIVDEAMTASRQAEGIEGHYYKRVLTVNDQEITLPEFVKQFCPDPNTRNDVCIRAFRIKKIDDVSGATKFLPNGL